MVYNTRPTVRKRLLGAKLKRARIAAGLSVEAVAEHEGSAPASVYRKENGFTAVHPSSIDFYAKLYRPKFDEGDPDAVARWDTEVERWREWARRSKDRGPWAASGAIVGPTYVDYADAESLADELRTWQPLVIPGLLQTRRYSEEVLRAGTPVHPGSSSSVEDLVEFRERRKEMSLARETPLRIWAVIGEAAISTPVGSKEDQKDQLQHLLNLGETLVRIQVLRFGSGPHTGLSGSFNLLSYGSDSILFREGNNDGSFNDDEGQVRAYQARYELLQADALSMPASRRYLHETLSKI